MHPIQKALLELAQTRDLGAMKLREISEAISLGVPQTIKYHMDTLLKQGRLARDGTGAIRLVDPEKELEGLIQVPVLGRANCGEALLYAEEGIQGFLPVSPTLLRTRRYEDIFAVQAVGRSMNNADIGGEQIHEGDFVIAQASPNYEDGDYVVATLEGRANIKRLYRGQDYIVLRAESYDPMYPIYIGEGDIDSFAIHGKVLQVLKAPDNLRYQNA
jgi:SOS-response transcriptional repressor LexA